MSWADRPACNLLTQQLSVGLQEPAQAQFDWAKQWYPLASTYDLDPERPHAAMLLGEGRCSRRCPWVCFVVELLVNDVATLAW